MERIHGSGTGWFAAPNRIFERDDLSIYAKMLYVYLCRRAGPDGCAWPSYQTMARECSMSPDSAARAIKTLEAESFITVERVEDPERGQLSNRYHFLPCPLAAASPPAGSAPPLPLGAGTPPAGSGTKDDHEKDDHEKKDTFCAEPPQSGRSTPAPVTIPEDLKSLSLYGTDPTLCAQWAELMTSWEAAYPRGREWIMAEVRKAHAWEVANRTKRKTSRGRPRFLGAWLDRAQNSGAHAGPIRAGNKTLDQLSSITSLAAKMKEAGQ